MKKVSILFAMLLVCAHVFAQSKIAVKGTIIEKETSEAVVAASVQLLSLPDSAYVDGTATTGMGVFEFKNLKKKRYVLKISYVGFITKLVEVDLEKVKKNNHDIGFITLATDAIMLKHAEVTANVAKVMVSGDSLVYNAAAYRVPEGSTLEALVKLLPGAKVDSDGNITINGKKVKKILVDGKEFFLDDKEVAMKNIPTDMIDKIKSYDRKSDLARITGIDDGEDETVLDLSVKKGMKNGWFGQLNLGAGTEDRYAERLNANRFKDNSKITLFGNANNVSDRGYGGGGGRGWGWGGWGGLRTSKDVGASIAHDSEKLEAGGSLRYRYDGSDVRNESSTENFRAEKGRFSESSSTNFTSNSSVRAQMRLEWRPDTMTNVIFRPTFNYSRNRGSSASRSGSYDDDPNDITDDALSYNDQIAEQSNGASLGQKPSKSATRAIDTAVLDRLLDIVVNTNTSRSQSYSTSTNFNGTLQYNRKFNNRGRNLTFRVNGGFSDGDSKQLSAANITYNSLGTSQRNNRYYTTPSRSRNITGQVTYSEPISDRTYLQFSYSYNYSYSKNDRRAQIYDSDAYHRLTQGLVSHRYDIPGILRFMQEADYMLRDTTALSQFSEYKNRNQTINLSFRRVRDAYNFNIGVDALPQHSVLNYFYMGQDYPEVTRDVFDIAPRINLKYNFTKQTYLQARYNGRSRQPSMTNLLDIRDDSNPLYIRRGNPDLKPSFIHSMNINFNTYNSELQQGIYSWLYWSSEHNAISDKTTYDKLTGVTTTKPMNINGNWYAGGSTGFNTGLGKEKAFNIGTELGAHYGENVGFYNNTIGDEDDNQDIKSFTRDLGLEASLDFGYRNDDFSVSLNGNIEYSHVGGKNLAAKQPDTYNFSYGGEFEWTMPWGTMLNTDIGMNSRRGYAQKSANTNELIWNAQLSHSFLKGHALTVMLEWNDILTQRTNISRDIDAFMRSDSRTNAIYQYGMLRIVYKFSILAGKNAMGTSDERTSDRDRGDWGGHGGWGGW